PHQVIEGALAAAVAVGASHVILYVNPRETAAVLTLGEAVAAWRSHTLFAKAAARIGRPLDIAMVVSSGLYVGGEETAAIAAIENRFPFPRRKPPFPAQEG